MRRFIATLAVLAQCCWAVPVFASSPSRPPLSESPCTLGNQFSTLRSDITKIGEEAREAGNVAIRIRRSSRHAPYKYVESAWSDIQSRSTTALKTLSKLENQLDSMGDDTRKEAAADLIITYQKAIMMFLDYGHFAVYDERRANAMSMRFYTMFSEGKKQGVTWISPGYEQEKTRMFGEVLGRQYLDQQVLEVNYAFSSLKLPEYRYAKACNNYQISEVKNSLKSVDGACDVADALHESHDTLGAIIADASEAEFVSKRLRRTSRWTPYKRVEAAWQRIIPRANSLIGTLSDIPIALDGLRNDAAKNAALDVVQTYQNAVLEIVDAAHFALFYERVSNGTGVASQDRGTITFGTAQQATKSSWDNYTRNAFEKETLTIGQAKRSLKLPEHRYHRVCNAFSLASSSSPPTTYPHALNPCSLGSFFSKIHAGVMQIHNEASDMGNTSARLYKTSLRHPYTFIENSWLDITSRSNEILDQLSSIPVALDQTSEGNQKKAAIHLTSSYQKAIENLVDYSRAALYNERTENSISMLFGNDRGALSFGVHRAGVKMNRDNIARAEFDKNFLKLNGSIRSTKIPEYLFEKMCGVYIATR
jgi:hypothetical protein